MTHNTREATIADLPSIVAVHEAAFSGFFLTMLGHRFLGELYRAFIVDHDGICWVAEAELPTGQSQVAGFVAGTPTPDRFFRRLLFRRGFHFAAAALPGLIRHPFNVLPRLLSALWYRGDQPSAVQRGTLMSSVGVHPRIARRGVGKALVDAFCEDCARRGAREVYLVTDQHGNEAANRFYEHAGFRLLTTRRRQDGRTMHTYTRTIAIQADRKH